MQDLPPLTENLDWQLSATCRGMDVDVFYHPPAERNHQRERRITQAKAICAQCPVINQCRQHALKAQEPYGIWGGLSEHERADLLGVEDLRYPARKPNAELSIQPRMPAEDRVTAP
jgi:WhiB family transcriptional regulator, redox-sensing transcriptional regulator